MVSAATPAASRGRCSDRRAPGHRHRDAAAAHWDRAGARSDPATAAAQAAWAVLAAYYHRLRHGGGDYIDFSRFEAVVQALDPPFGSQGQAASGLKRSGGWRGRPWPWR